jgi:hypothetical protein
MFFKKDHSIQSNRSRSYVRSILSVVITLSLFASSVPMSTYAGIQAPPPRK